jgi:hypothetical protein
MAQFGIDDYIFETVYYFPCCPKKIQEQSLEAYYQNLNMGSVFAYNDDSPKLIIVAFVKIKINSAILVMCERESVNCEREAFKPWSITEISIRDNLIVHSKLGSYFEKDCADKSFYVKQRLEWAVGETFDNF